jgi:hypothetical protein
LLGIHFPNPDTGYAVGNGIIIKYTTPCTPAAPVSINAGSAILCSFDTVTFCVPPVANATSYNWILPSGNSIVSGQGDTCVAIALGNQTSGNITCNTVNGCGPGGLILLSIVVEPSPAPPTITLVGSQLMSDSANNIQWYLNGVPIPGEINQFYTFTQNGSYTVVYTSPVGCTAVSAPYDMLSVGINSANVPEGIFIYPNPADKELRMQNTRRIESVEMYDVVGERILNLTPVTSSTAAGNIAIDVSKLETGIYFVKVIMEKEIFTERLLISR